MIQELQALNTAWNNIDLTEQIAVIIDELANTKKSISKVDFEAIKNDFGVYVFYIKPTKTYTLETLQKDWEDNIYSNYPKVVKKRFLKHKNIELDSQYPFYIGKSEKLKTRIKEHITHSGKTSTYSLKLEGRKYFNNQTITFSYWKLPTELEKCSPEIKQFLITQIESKLRDRLNPWVGKK
ncbi:hypothetical protein WH52_07230 [Tenacibaculum holothuriorum]|uniref:GIY-YIG domain-containing protein n=1 Tax=Tenacibaculum holothuriorum TaxID=1635173 RepID=A0A1Y2PDI8_9FLAO|nr:hypothetical protein [Tenacibaculum holothuriorum]OSY88532.1 hypothetical protein WH52_07230 [Tenacibaculum holothuriorum]